MKDNLDNPLVFEKYFADFYGRVFNYWYWILQNKHSQPIYIAQQEVCEKDPEYFSLVSSFVHNETSLDGKVTAADKIREHIFLTSIL